MADVFQWIFIVFLAVVAVILVREDWNLWAAGTARARGTVFDHRRTTDDGADYYLARVRFTDADGAMVEFDDNYGKSTPQPPVGDTVEVVYARGRSTVAQVYRPIWRLIIYLCVLGPLALLLAKTFGWIKG